MPVISSMGAGNKLDGSQFRIADIYKTKTCPLAKVMRRELRRRGVKKLKVVYSEEEVIKQTQKTDDCSKRITVGSVSFVPSVAGMIMAGEIIKDLIS